MWMSSSSLNLNVELEAEGELSITGLFEVLDEGKLSNLELDITKISGFVGWSCCSFGQVSVEVLGVVDESGESSGEDR